MFRKSMFGRVGFVLLWAGFVFYAVVLAPPQQPDTFELIGKLATGQWANINPAIVALFNLMGVWPMIYACLALIDGAEQKLPAWPFVSLGFGVGAFALLPYLALRKPKPEPVNYSEADKTKLIQLVDSPWTGRAIALTSLFLVIYGITQGNWSDFAQQWQTSQFINVMSLDFCMLCAVVAPLVKSDMARRGMDSSVLFWIATLVPLLGVVVYLSVRSPLSQIDPAARPSSPEQSPT